MRGHFLFPLALLIGCNMVLGNESGQLRDDLNQGSAHGTSACAKGFADCNDDTHDGCETDLSEPSHCGGCNTVCSATSPLCVSAQEGTFACASGCPPEAPSLCGYQCVDRTINASHCGVCGHTCPGDAHGQSACHNGACDVTCTAGYHACGGKCIATTDPSACGDACVTCAAGPNGSAVCDKNACSLACLPGYANCDNNLHNGCETAVLQDAKHCGSCSTVCASNARCVGGFCLPFGAPLDSPPQE
ncbi:MAG TPA: hypothetical protein VNO21_06760 [Polyangiaceae bacterium]|nr:hypothetical protein [Polyangiaceae bacterium]